MEGEEIEVTPIRIQGTSKQIQNKNGSQTMASLKIFFEPGTVENSHKIIYEGKKYEILSLLKCNDASGALHHLEVYV